MNGRGAARGAACLVVAVLIGSLATPVQAAAAPGPTAARPRLALRAPATASVGDVVTVEVVATGAGSIGAWETALRFDPAAVEVLAVEPRRDPLPWSGRRPQPLGTVQVPGSVTVGAYTCRGPDCGAGPPAAHDPSRGTATLATFHLALTAPGDVELAIGPTVVTDASGGPLSAPAAPSTRVRVGTGGPDRPAAPPSLGSGRAPRPPARTGPVDRTDATEVAAAWEDTRRSDGTCTGDDCLDVGDVQAVAALAVSDPATAVAAVTYTVDSTGDAVDARIGDKVCRTGGGTCTLRAALTEAARDGGPSTVSFAIPGTGPHTIQVGTTRLPALNDLTGPTTIDGFTQPGSSPNTAATGSNAVIRVEIRGTGNTGVEGLFVSAPGNVIRGLALYDLKGAIRLYGVDARSNVVVGNHIGTNAAATAGYADYAAGNMGVNIQAGAALNVIGRPVPADRNVISGNGQHGVALYDDGTDGNLVQNNVVGLSPDGTRRVPNRRNGVDVNSWASGNVVGGTGPSEGNVLSGNVQHGIEVSHGTGTTGNRVVGNLVGTDLAGATTSSTFGNLNVGIHVEDFVAATEVTDNVVGGNVGGILVARSATGTTVARNHVGITTGGAAISNGAFGIRADGVPATTIGPGNTVSNHGAGIHVVGDTTSARITANSTFGHTGFGIDIDPLSQVNPNDTDDADTGPNGRLNFPVVTATTPTTVSGTACAGCTVEVFVADAPAASHGEGRTFLATAKATSTGTFTATVPPASQVRPVTATATDAAGNTSEFSRNVDVPASAGDIAPTASFTASCTRLSCSFDGSASSDPDGTVTAWAWDFGDGSFGTGSTVSHTYATDGTRTVRLTVTSSDGGTASTERKVTVASAVTVAADAFERSVTNGWGTADTGGPWTPRNNPESFLVTGGAGAVDAPPGSDRAIDLRGVSVTDVDLTVSLSTDQAPPAGSWGHVARVVTRRTAADTQYRARVRIAPGGAVYVAAARLSQSWTEVVIGTEVRVPDLTVAPGQRVRVRFQTIGTSPTTLRIRAWAADAAEPSAWQVDTTDSTTTLQGPGAVGVHAWIPATLPAKVRYLFDDLVVVTP